MGKQKNISIPKNKTTSIKTSSNESDSSWISGLFGHIFAGTTFNCDVQDKSFFCTLSKVFASIMMILILLFILYLIFLVASSFRKRR